MPYSEKGTILNNGDCYCDNNFKRKQMGDGHFGGHLSMVIWTKPLFKLDQEID